ncbi:MAG: glycosyltransferase family 2 protein [Candidatus Woesearchaeota archaeon]
MKLIINIPCYNEEKTLPLVLKEIPRKIPGISAIEVQIVDDGSTDKTVEVARKFGCHIITHKQNLGLGVAFAHGIEAALNRGCDIFVNTDGDNQYPSGYIKYLVKPILDGSSDIVIGNRTPWKVKYFSPLKRTIQFFGNMLARNIASSDVPDMVSGFRAYNKESLLKLNVTTKFSYVIDTIAQASKKGLKIISVDIRTNAPTRKSRLSKNLFQHMKKSFANIVQLYITYEPFKTFLFLSMIFIVPGVILVARFLWYYFHEVDSGHIQSLIIAAIGFILGAILFSLGVIAELIRTNRRLIEEQLYLKKKELYKRK